MPICNKPAQALSAKTAATEVDDHASEAAKMKRTREQAYFNSYDFDAIEVLPYDDDDDDDGAQEGLAAERGRKPPSKYAGHPTLAVGQAANGTSSSRRWLQASPNGATTTTKTTTSSALKPPTHPSSASLSAAQQQQQQHCSSSKAANSSATANSVASSSRSSSGSTASTSTGTGTDDARYSMMKYSYLQRLGAFLIKSQQDRAPVDDDDDEAELNGVAEVGAAEAAHATVAVNGPEPPNDHDSGPGDMPPASGNFLLPRAMLKYQSANSMPVASGSGAVTPPAPPSSTPATPSLAAVAAAAATAIGQGNRQQFGAGSSNNNNGPNKPSAATAPAADNDKAAPVARMMNTATNAIAASNGSTISTTANNNNSNNFGKTITMNGNGALKAPAPATTTYPDGHAAASTTAAATVATATTPSAAGVLAKKLSTSSTLTTTTAATSTSAESESEASHAKAPQPPQHASSKGKAATAASLTPLAPRGRTGSHQSHYSTTDKSGSSGYYSSNVCSTYSLDDHIYCEPHIDILEVSQAKGMRRAATTTTLKSPQSQIGLVEIHQPVAQPHGATTAVSRARDMNLAGSSSGGQTAKQQLTLSADDNEGDDDGDEDEDEGIGKPHLFGSAASPIHFSEQLRVLESSIENLDRHLKNFPGSLGPQEHIVSFVQTAYNHQLPHQPAAHLMPYHHLPTIMEGLDQQQQQQQLHRQQQKAPNLGQQWRHDQPDGGPDDSLMDIDLDSFLLVNERHKHTTKQQTLQQPQHKKVYRVGIDNPSFLTDEQEENHYKCAKYINSCPEDAYRVESDIVAPGTANGTLKSSTVDTYHKRYEDQVHFQSTRELLEDVRDKIRLLSHVRDTTPPDYDCTARIQTKGVPRELEGMIKTLQSELDSYLSRMNRHSELEIRQLYSGMVKNQNVVKMKKAFERRRSLAAHGGDTDFSAYEAIQDGILVSAQGVPLSIRQQITSIRCASDPNFKMKRKSLAEIFPIVNDFVPESRDPVEGGPQLSDVARSQLQRNLSYHKPVLNQLDSQIGGPNGGGGGIGSNGSTGGSSGGGAGEKDSISEWHSKKPSIWEMYYGTNRLNQSLLGKQRSGMVLNPPSQGTMSYPSSRPESDFTLDLPRAEQLRIKMAKEKKFRQRCRFITTFLSLVFFLLTVMVVSLVLTRGKRMFGSMI